MVLRRCGDHGDAGLNRQPLPDVRPRRVPKQLARAVSLAARGHDDIARSRQPSRQRPDLRSRRARAPRRTRRRVPGGVGASTPRRAVSIETSVSATFDRSTYIESRFATEGATSAGSRMRKDRAATDRATARSSRASGPSGVEAVYRQAFAGSVSVSAESWPFKNFATVLATASTPAVRDRTRRPRRAREQAASAMGESASGSKAMG